ncbi:MAG TPA: hypothetical protein VMG08_11880 [Allosphingosinicella sp.]|nr:hypothetical protein [Allosphingosinicella sp.]
MRSGFLAALGLSLAACGGALDNNISAAGNAAGGDTAGADAARQRPIPCSVQAHGMGAVVNGTAAQGPCDSSVDPQTVALDDLIRIVPDQHPSFYYILAQRLFAGGRRDEAVFWFYAGQLRYRIRLACHPDLAPDTEPALFAALSETVGAPVNEYAFGDLDALVATLERARTWDAETRNGFEPKAPCATAIAQQREGMGQLIAHVRDNGAELRRHRAANGLPNR